MSNVITHYETRPEFYACGKAPGVFVLATTDRTAFTCKRCLASLAKRDRHFRARARAGMALVLIARVHRREVSMWASERSVPMVEAARAIAAEEAPNGTPLGAMQRWQAICQRNTAAEARS